MRPRNRAMGQRQAGIVPNLRPGVHEESEFLGHSLQLAANSPTFICKLALTVGLALYFRGLLSRSFKRGND